MASTKKSAGILMYRFTGEKQLQAFLVHPGGPYWAKKDAGAWSIPKGEFDETEDPLESAKREFKEETGHDISGQFTPLTPRKQKTGKVIYAWALKGDVDQTNIKSNLFELEWPPKSGKKQMFPEVDRAGWFLLSEAREKIIPGQVGFIDELEIMLGKIDIPDPNFIYP